MQDKPKNLKLILLNGIWKHLSKRRRKQLIILPILISIAGVSEIFSIASVIPFLNALSGNSENINFPLIENLNKLFSGSNLIDPFLLLITTFLVFISLSAILRLLTLLCSNYFSAAIGSDFSIKAYRLSLIQPYSVHIKRNSSEIISSIIQNSERTVTIIDSILQLSVAIVIGVALIASLFLINWSLSFLIVFLFTSLYLILGKILKRRINRISKKKANLTILQTKALQEGLGSIRDIILDNNQNLYTKIFSSSDKPLRFINAKSAFLSSSPRYIFELITIYIIVLITYIYSQYFGITNIVPLLGSIVLCLQRLLPIFQSGYAAWVSISVNTDSALNLLSLLNQSDNKYLNKNQSIILEDKIKLINISFSYSHYSKNLFSNFNLEIKKGEIIGIIGPSGSGKSTIADIIMGLIKPTHGRIEIDGVDLHNNNFFSKEDWFRNISHVPQDIYLSDTNIAENIAFGIPPERINKKKLLKAIHSASLSKLIKDPNDAFNTKVGERGIQLSGGQRQRIGIARAIYKGGNILILDEATSALDIKTEGEIIETIDNLSSELTIIIITHRPSTLLSCNRVIDLSKI